ncbi:MAG: hypothetical protein PHN56_01530 [Candidatus Nanoarchaeia archaeon]|nr:hypothetical protein [Candidatus Nanoarchaeia archaeon]
MAVKEAFNRIKYAFKLIFNKELYENSINFNQLLDKKEEKFDKSVDKYQKLLAEKSEKFRNKLEETKKESYNKGYFDGEYNYLIYLKEEFSKKTSVKSEDLEHLLFDVDINYEFRGLKKDYATEFSSRCLKELGRFEDYAKSLSSFIKDFDKQKIELVNAGICNGIINYLLLASNIGSFEKYAILDTSYLSKFREKYYRKIISPKSLNADSEGLIVPIEVVKEYNNIIKSETKNISRIKKIIKEDIIQLLTNPKLILVPPFKSLKFINEKVLEKFTDIRENGEVHFHKADLEIYEFYKRFGEQFDNIYLLSADMGLNNEMIELSKNFRENHNLNIIEFVPL